VVSSFLSVYFSFFLLCNISFFFGWIYDYLRLLQLVISYISLPVGHLLSSITWDFNLRGILERFCMHFMTV
jgi:hypothetical protein